MSRLAAILQEASDLLIDACTVECAQQMEVIDLKEKLDELIERVSSSDSGAAR